LQQNYVLEAKRYRLYEHIRANILHYCRAIWEQEDPQQRLLRYRKAGVRVPLRWVRTVIDADDVVDALTGGGDGIPITFVADESGPSVLLADLINPAGPIGYFGNFAVYYLRQEYASPDIFEVLQHFKAPYVELDAEGEPILMEPREKELAEIAKARITTEIALPVKDDMIRFIPELRLLYRRAKRTDSQAKKPEDATAVSTLFKNETLFKDYYAEYLFRKERARQLVVDTNSLMVDILPGDGSALEKFKLAHRAMDIQKVLEEKRGAELENSRRAARMGKDNLDDPDTERVVVFGGTAPVPAVNVR
jgi:hypothetical protein